MPRRRSERKFAAILLIILGLLFLLDDVTGYDVGDLFSDWWPLILILVGLRHLRGGGSRNKASGVFLIVLGAVFLAANLHWIHWRTVGNLWPLVLIGLGAWLLLRRKQIESAQPESDEGLTDVFAFLGGSERVVVGTFSGGNTTAILGGIELDLTGAELAEGKSVLHITAIFGGVEMTVPGDWDVEITGFPVLGGISDKRRPQPAAKKSGSQLVIDTFVLLGGVEVKGG